MAQNDDDSASGVEALVIVVVVFGRGDAVTGKYQGRFDAGTRGKAQRNKGFLEVQPFGVVTLSVDGDVHATELCPHHQVKVLEVFAVVAAGPQSELAKGVGDVVARQIEFPGSVATALQLIARQELDWLEKLVGGERLSGLRPAKLCRAFDEADETYAKSEGDERPVSSEDRSFSFWLPHVRSFRE